MSVDGVIRFFENMPRHSNFFKDLKLAAKKLAKEDNASHILYYLSLSDELLKKCGADVATDMAYLVEELMGHAYYDIETKDVPFLLTYGANINERIKLLENSTIKTIEVKDIESFYPVNGSNFVRFVKSFNEKELRALLGNVFHNFRTAYLNHPLVNNITKRNYAFSFGYGGTYELLIYILLFCYKSDTKDFVSHGIRQLFEQNWDCYIFSDAMEAHFKSRNIFPYTYISEVYQHINKAHGQWISKLPYADVSSHFALHRAELGDFKGEIISYKDFNEIK